MIDIAALKETVDLERAFNFLDLEWPASSRRHPVMLCPFLDHDERTPSCTLYPEDDRVWCYGCDRGGDVIDFVGLVKGLDFIGAVQEIAEWAGLDANSIRTNYASTTDPNQMYKQIENQAYVDVLSWVKRHGLSIKQADAVFPEYDEIVRAKLAKEIDTEDAVNRLLAWRQRWQQRLA